MGINITGDNSGPVLIPIIHGAKPATREDFERAGGAGHVGLAVFGPLSTIFKATRGGSVVAEVLVSQNGGVMNADLLHDAPGDACIDARLISAVRKFAQEQHAVALRINLPIALPYPA